MKDKARKREATCSFMIDLNNLKQSVDLHFKFRLSPTDLEAALFFALDQPSSLPAIAEVLAKTLLEIVEWRDVGPPLTDLTQAAARYLECNQSGGAVPLTPRRPHG